jgi:hypothetical protein
MVITPLKPSRFEAKVPAEPKPDEQQVNPKPNPLTLVVAINKADRKVTLNNENMGDVSDATPLTEKLTTVLRKEKTPVFSEKERMK